MKTPFTLTLQLLAWLTLLATIAITWAGWKYPYGRAKAHNHSHFETAAEQRQTGSDWVAKPD